MPYPIEEMLYGDNIKLFGMTIITRNYAISISLWDLLDLFLLVENSDLW